MQLATNLNTLCPIIIFRLARETSRPSVPPVRSSHLLSFLLRYSKKNLNPLCILHRSFPTQFVPPALLHSHPPSTRGRLALPTLSFRQMLSKLRAAIPLSLPWLPFRFSTVLPCSTRQAQGCFTLFL